LRADDSGILDVSSLAVRKSPADDFDTATRKKASDFENFEHLFKAKHAELASGDAKLAPFPGLQRIEEGSFFVLDGVMLFIAEVGEAEYKKSTVRENRRERLRVIFEKDRKSTRLNSSHVSSSYAVFCLKKKT